jgi:hypothetical protein
MTSEEVDRWIGRVTTMIQNDPDFDHWPSAGPPHGRWTLTKTISNDLYYERLRQQTPEPWSDIEEEDQYRPLGPIAQQELEERIQRDQDEQSWQRANGNFLPRFHRMPPTPQVEEWYPVHIVHEFFYPTIPAQPGDLWVSRVRATAFPQRLTLSQPVFYFG